MYERHSGLRCVLMAAIVAVAVTAPVLADGLAEYSGLGTVYVIEDGRVVLAYDTSPAQDANGLNINDASGHYLISNGTNSTLLAPDVIVPPDTKTKVALNGTGCQVVGEFKGTLCVADQGGDQWYIEVQDDSSTLIFDYYFGETGTTAGSGGCSVNCAHGSCNCSAPGICWCFCGLFGEPECIHILIVIGTSL